MADKSYEIKITASTVFIPEQSDVNGGRQHLNVSEWDKPQPDLARIVGQIQSGEMPPLKYKIMPNHANARLSSKDGDPARRLVAVRLARSRLIALVASIR